MHINEKQEMKGETFSFKSTYFIISFVLLVFSAHDAVATSTLFNIRKFCFWNKVSASCQLEKNRT